jgi:hypothetical protein
MSKRLKDIIKINPAPARGVLGVNPMDPWSPKAGLAEDNMLNKFLSSRGINPGFVSKDTKISHAKSSAFLKWKQDHQYEEVEINEDKWLDRFLSSRGVDPKFVTTDRKVSYAKSGEFAKWLRDHQSEEVETEESENIQEVSGMGMRPTQSHVATQSDHDTVKKHLKNLMAIDSDEPTATSAVHRAIRKMSTVGTTSTKTRSKEMLSALVQKHHIPIDKEHRALLNREHVENFDEAKKPTSLEKFRKAAAEREKKHDDIEKEMKARHAAGKEDMKGSIDRLAARFKTEESGVSKQKETSFHKNLDKLVHNTFGKRKDEMKKEEYTNKKFVTIKKKVTEAVFQDPQAATQSPSDGANNPNEVSEKKRQMSKSARMIKSLYKNRKMTEAADGQSGGGISIDSEKIDKGETTYGKKPKIALTDKDANAGENKPDALAVMSGGRTLTGQERDSVEIDPAMKKRPGQPDSGPKQDGKIR